MSDGMTLLELCEYKYRTDPVYRLICDWFRATYV